MGKQKTDEAYAELMREYASSNEIADLQKLISLKGKRAIVAGGAGMGLGAAVSRRLASQGAEVAILDVDGVRAAEVATELTAAYGARALAVEGDLTTVAGVGAATGDVFAQFGTVDILVPRRRGRRRFSGAILRRLSPYPRAQSSQSHVPDTASGGPHDCRPAARMKRFQRSELFCDDQR
jgi:short chain dehydrogenase